MKKRFQAFWSVFWNFGIFLMFFFLEGVVGIYKIVNHQHIFLERLIPDLLFCLVFAHQGYVRWRKRRKAGQENQGETAQ